ncbi:MAG: hypothetical protein O2854_09185 [Chloroflexi bacterium]|nr:hypothetical protein [Chloroflexota bacterium]
MTTSETQKAIGRLKLLLASVRNKEDEMESLRRDFERQLQRATRSAVHGDGPLDMALSAMSEIEGRLQHTKSQLRHLASVKNRAQGELDALELTTKVEKAKADLKTLRERKQSGTLQEGDAEETTRLEQFIEDASMRAGKNITGESE